MSSNHLVFIRTDGNSQIASGHLMRCISIANACRELGMKVHFLVSDKESISFFQEKSFADFPITCLESAAYDHLEWELPELLSLLADCDHQKTIFLLDSYFVTEKYLESVGKLAKTAYIDDLMLFDYPVDFLVNYDVISSRTMPAYQAAYANAGKTLLGAAYAPLRGQFQNREMPLRKQVKNILITTGGSDPFHFCLYLIRALKEMISVPSPKPFPIFEGVTFHMIIGAYYTDKEALYSLGQACPFLKLYENVTDMATLMESCDLAVSAAGTTLYELCALGVPSISFTMADNQVASANAFDESGIIPYSGDIRTSTDYAPEKILKFLTRMSGFDIIDSTPSAANSYAKRKIVHQTMRSFIDGKGSQKIARTMLEL